VAKPKRAAKRDRDQVVLTDPRAIKALAHPARLAVIEELFSGRQLTATECAEIAGLSPSAMSYHLRALERWGIVKRADASADGRERPWRAAGTGLRLESQSARLSGVAEATVAGALLDRVRRDVLDWLAGDEHIQSRWRDLVDVNIGLSWMTEDEGEQFAQAFNEFKDTHVPKPRRQPPEGARRVRLAFVIVPTDEPED
jgi:DNA-binding transcriptional ArsR family regulator